MLRRTFLRGAAAGGACVPAALAGLGSKDVQYMGGTWTTIRDGLEGRLLIEESQARFVAKGADVAIPFAAVSSLEYGQKAGRRVGAAAGLAVISFGIGGLMLLSKKRKHYLTIGYRDEKNGEQGIVLQLGKDITRSTLTAFEVKSGRKVEYQSQDARAHVGN